MANEDTNSETGPLVEIFFYIDPDTKEIDDVLCFGPFTIMYRYDFDWDDCTLEESGLDDELKNHLVYKHIWETDEVEMTLDFDFDDYDLVTPEPVKLFDRGELTMELLAPYALPGSDKVWITYFREHPLLE